MGIDHEWARIFTNGEGGMGRGVLFAGREVLVVEGPVPWTVSFLGDLGVSRFSGTKRVRAKDAKDAKVRKGDY